MPQEPDGVTQSDGVVEISLSFTLRNTFNLVACKYNNVNYLIKIKYTEFRLQCVQMERAPGYTKPVSLRQNYRRHCKI